MERIRQRALDRSLTSPREPERQRHPARQLIRRRRPSSPTNPHDSSPAGLHLPRHRADRDARPPIAATSPPAAYRIARRAGRTSFPPPWRVPAQTVCARSASHAQTGHRRDDAHRHLASRARQIDTTQRQAVNTDGHLIKPLDRRLNVDRVAPQAIQLRHHKHVVTLQPIEQLQEARTL